jgi:hypothetical protein
LYGMVRMQFHAVSFFTRLLPKFCAKVLVSRTKYCP